jgi:cold shock CspA family protein
MALTGTLRSWNDERGFGFIAPTHGGAELFVHVSAFPNDGSRPTVGESLSYELGRGKNGQPQAIKAFRQAVGPRTRASRTAGREPKRRRVVDKIVGLVLLVAIGAYGYQRYQQSSARHAARPQSPAAQPVQSAEAVAPTANFSCDGRIHCSQMTSCTEAKFFLKNCPGTRMDGDHDGVPCEQQWCTSPFAK